MTNEQEAVAALAEMRQARARASRMRPLPLLYHLAFGAMMAGFVVAISLPLWSFGLALAGLMLLGALLYHWQRRATGRWVSGYRTGRTVPVTILMLVTMFGLLASSNPQGAPNFNLFTPVQGAVLAFVLGTALDWLWMLVYNREQVSGR